MKAVECHNFVLALILAILSHVVQNNLNCHTERKCQLQKCLFCPFLLPLSQPLKLLAQHTTSCQMQGYWLTYLSSTSTTGCRVHILSLCALITELCKDFKCYSSTMYGVHKYAHAWLWRLIIKQWLIMYRMLPHLLLLNEGVTRVHPF